MRYKKIFIPGLLVVGLVAGLLTACNKQAENKTYAYKIVFTEQENSVEPYQTRVIVTPEYIRFDDGKGAKDFVLFDRKLRQVHSVVSQEGTLMTVNEKHTIIKPPFDLELSEKRLKVSKDVPAIDNTQPDHYQLFARGELCYDVIAVKGLMQPVVKAFMEYKTVMASDSASMLGNVPADMHNACDLAQSTFAATRHLKHGFPILESDKHGYVRTLIDYDENYKPEPGLFELPKGYKSYTVQEFREGKVSFSD